MPAATDILINVHVPTYGRTTLMLFCHVPYMPHLCPAVEFLSSGINFSFLGKRYFAMVTDHMRELCTKASCLHGHVFWTLMMMITLVVEQVQTAEMLLSHCFGNGWELWVSMQYIR